MNDRERDNQGGRRLFLSPLARLREVTGARGPIDLAILSLEAARRLIEVHLKLKRCGLKPAFQALSHPLTLVDPARAHTPLEEGARTDRLCRLDDVMLWLLSLVRFRSICLYRALAMTRALSELDGGIWELTLVIGLVKARREGKLDAHAWVLFNGKEFRQDRAVWDETVEIARLTRAVAA